MIRYFMALLLLVMFEAGGCAGDKGKELFETARFEEVQHNQEHAVQLYREILEKYPGSDYAEKAGKRLSEISQAK